MRSVLVLLAILLGACAAPGPLASTAPSPSSAVDAPSSESAQTAYARCDELDDAGGLDLPPAATPEGVIPTPAVQVAHAQREALMSWAQTEHADTYGGMWIDGDALVIAFTDQIDARRPEVQSRFTDTPVHVVEVPHSETDLFAINQEVIGLLNTDGRSEDGWISGMGVRTNLNRVSIDIIGDAAVVHDDLLAAAPVDAVCLDVHPIPGPADAVSSPWSIPPGSSLGSETATLEVWVHERACASGQPATDRVVVQEVTVAPDTITISLGVFPAPGDSGCPGNPPTPFVVDLPEPLGDRRLIDGSTGNPPMDPEAALDTSTTAPPRSRPRTTTSPMPTPTAVPN